MKEKKTGVIKHMIRTATRPAFIFCVVLATCFWYLNKLGNTYTTSITIPVKIIVSEAGYGANTVESNVKCLAHGVGFRLIKYKLFPTRKVVVLDISDLYVKPSELGTTSEIRAAWLLSAISNEITDIRIISILSPAIEIENQKTQ